MPPRGRPRLTPADVEARLQAYCRRYAVAPTTSGLPPFPTGRRETPQHREWLALYKAHARLRAAAEPAAPSTLQGTRCPACGGDGAPHERCEQLTALARELGPDALDRVRRRLWPPKPRGRGRT